MDAAGYVADLEYTHGYFRNLSPRMLRFACLSAGVAPPPLTSYLELGFGQGVSLAAHSATCDGQFWGADIMPSQVMHAQDLIASSGSGARVVDDSFVELASRSDLPEFDVIVLHGIWSWVSDENRHSIVDIIRRKLKIGGLVYISYNCLPGWAPGIPNQHLMQLRASFAGGSSTEKADDALAFMQRVLGAGALYYHANPAALAALREAAGKSRTYIAHEYLNANWAAMGSADVAAWLRDAKLTFIGSGNLAEHPDATNLTPDGVKLLADIGNPVLRQTTRDYLVNQKFRTDLFIKGPRRLSAIEQREAMQSEIFALGMPAEDVPARLPTSLGEVALQEAIYRPLYAKFASNTAVPFSAIDLPFEQAMQAVQILVGAAILHPAQEPTAEMRKRSAALNLRLCERARGSAEVEFLASPVVGGALHVWQFQQLFMLAQHRGHESPASHAAFAWEAMASQSVSVMRDGKPVIGEEESIAELARCAEIFLRRRHVLDALGISLPQ